MNRLLLKKIALLVTCIVTVTASVYFVNQLILTEAGPQWLTDFLIKFIFLAYTVSAIISFAVVFGIIMLIKSIMQVISAKK